MRRFISRRVAVVGVSAIIVCVSILASVFMAADPTRALMKCRIASDPSNISMSRTCINVEVEQLLKYRSAQFVMKAISGQSSPVDIVKNCHGIAHAIGASVYRSSGSVERALSQCTSQCAGGCLHGVVETAIEEAYGEGEDSYAVHDTTVLVREGKKYCSDPELCHGVGHLLYKEFEDYSKALALCGSISTDMNSERCYEGVFMESLGDESSFGFPRAPETKPQQTDYAYPCTQQESRYRLACFRFLPAFQDALFHTKGITDSVQKVRIQRDVCDSFPAPDRLKCVFGLGGLVTARVYHNDFNAVARMCRVFFTDEPARRVCTMGVVTNWTQFGLNSAAINICLAETGSEQTDCLHVVFELLRRSVDERAVQAACRASHDPELCTERSRDEARDPGVGQRIERSLIGTPI